MPSNPASRPRFGWLPPALDPLGRWAVAAAVFLAALALRLELAPDAARRPFLLFMPAVLLAAWLGGRGPGLAVTLASALAGWWFALRSPGTLGWPSAADAAALALFLATSGFAACLVAGLVRAAPAAPPAPPADEDADPEALAAELQHRVANNLQLVASALTQQARGLDGDAAAALREAVRRLDDLSRLHRRLLRPGVVDGAAVLTELCRRQLDASGGGRLALEVAVDPALRLNAGQLTTIGMIASEAVSNALKHAFPDGRPGRIGLRLAAAPSGLAALEVRDDGVGLPPGGGEANAGSLGLRIMRSLAQRLGGTLQLATERGTVVRVMFPPAPPAPL